MAPPDSPATMPSVPVPTSGASDGSSGTAWRCMLEPISARLASSFSRKGISAAATDTSCLGETSMKSMESFIAMMYSPPLRQEIRSSTNLPFLSIRSEEQTSELQSLMSTSYDVFCLKKKKKDELEDI